MEVDCDSIEWYGIVVVDHPSPPDAYGPRIDTESIPVVAILRRDWEFLFDQLRSTHFVARYVERISTLDVIPLGEEPVRYYRLAQDDAATSPGAMPADLYSGGAELDSSPELPFEPASEYNPAYFSLMRILQEDIAISEFVGEEAMRCHLLALIDSVPVRYRAELGELMYGWLRELHHPDAVGTSALAWRSRHIRALPPEPLLVFAVCSEPLTDDLIEAWKSYVYLRHHQHCTALDDFSERVYTIGIVLTPLWTDPPRWQTTMAAIRADPLLTPDEVATLEERWPLGGNFD